MILNHEGNILDDVMYSCINNEIFLVVNASNKSKINKWINNNLSSDTVLEDMNEENSFIALQGPNSEKLVKETFNLDLNQLKRMTMDKYELVNESVYIMRSGYTGEDGFEFIGSHEAIENIFTALLSNGAIPCGLGARDTLRIEVGLPLYGQELSDNINPFQTRYSWVVKEAHDFIGKEELLTKKDSPNKLVTVGLTINGPQICRTNYKIKEGGMLHLEQNLR